MPLIKCAECGKEISTLAPACPSCGAPRAVAGGNRDQNLKTVVVYKTTSNAGVLTGILGSFFAILGIFTLGWLFLPFAVLFSAISLLSGIIRLSATGGAMAVVSCVLTLIGFSTSPVATLAALSLLGHVIGAPKDEGPNVNQASPVPSVDALVDDILKTKDSKREIATQEQRLKTPQPERQTTGMPYATSQQSAVPVNDCDRLAANPTDARRYPGLPGVQFKELRDNLNAALTTCTAAVSTYPKEMRFRYQLARGLQMRDKKAAFAIFQELALASYPAAFDNLGWLSISESNDYPKAIEYFQTGYALGDVDCAVSLYEMIDRDKWTVPNPAAMRIALLEKAAAGNHAGAVVALPIEREKQAIAQSPNQMTPLVAPRLSTPQIAVPQPSSQGQLQTEPDASQLEKTANDQLDSSLARGLSPVATAKEVAANWNREKMACSANAKDREAEYHCHDMVIYGSGTASKWLDVHQKDGEIIYGLQVCVEIPGIGTRCNASVVLPPTYQGKSECSSIMSGQANTLSVVSRVSCLSRIARSQPWVVEDSKRGLEPMKD